MEKQINEKKPWFLNCATKVRFFLSNFWGAVQKGCFFYRFLVLRLHKKAL